MHSEIRKNDDLTEFIKEKAGARVLFGEMSVVLVDDTIVYIRPVYVEANSATAVPELQRIVAVNGDRIFMGRTVDEAIEGVISGGGMVTTTDASASDDAQSGEQALAPAPNIEGLSVIELITAAEQQLADADAAERNGLDTEAAELRERARVILAEAQRLLGGTPVAPTTTQPPTAQTTETTEAAEGGGRGASRGRVGGNDGEQAPAQRGFPVCASACCNGCSGDREHAARPPLSPRGVLMFRRVNPADLQVPAPEDTLPGRPDPVPVPDAHFVNGNPLVGPFPDGMETIMFGMGCFWGAERFYWQTPASTRRPPSTPEARRRTRATRRPAPA